MAVTRTTRALLRQRTLFIRHGADFKADHFYLYKLWL